MQDESIFRIIAIATVIMGMTISIYHRRKAAKAGNERVSRREEGARILIFLRLFGLATWLTTFAYLINPQWVRWASVELPVWLRWVGVALGLTSIPLLYWLFSSLGKNVTDTVALRQAHTLVTHGPYRWVRHPLYSVSLLFFSGLSLMAANWFMLLAMLLALVMLVHRTPVEEAKLIEKFGDEYRDYMRRTGRYLPQLGSTRT